jgi:hypothetical protein
LTVTGGFTVLIYWIITRKTAGGKKELDSFRKGNGSWNDFIP